MAHDHRHRRSDPVHLTLGFAPQVLPALEVAEWLTGGFCGKRHRVRPGETTEPVPPRRR